MSNKILLVEDPPTKFPDDLINAHEVASMLSVSVSWVKDHCTRVKPFLPHVRLGGGRYINRRFKREHILKFIEENTILTA